MNTNCCLKVKERKNTVRIDKFLKNSRIIKRRTVAKEACLQERILINDKVAKAGSEVYEGDIVDIKFGNSTLRIKVKNLIESQRKEDAEKMYETI